MTSEVDFAKGASVSFEKSKIMKTYNAIKLRMQSRFTKNGVLDAKLFLVSSKKSEQDFIESYIETVKNDPSVMICDDSQWAVKPPGTFSNKRFKVAVGNKKLHSKIVMKDDNIEDLKKQGFRIIDVPLELQRYFQRDIERALMDLAGISTSLTTKFISYDSVAKCYSKLRKNPFGMNILEIGTEDKFQISDFFHPELISEALITKPIFIHFDMSLTGDRTGISAVASVGAREELQYVNGDMSPVKELLYAHLFSVGIQCPAGAEISLEKNRKFVYYLKYALGWNIQGISADGFQSRDTLQQFTQSGFNTRLLSLDRTPDGYLYTKASLNERRISMLEIPELETELINLERNNMTGKVDHPVNGCFSGDTSILMINEKGFREDIKFSDLVKNYDAYKKYKVISYNMDLDNIEISDYKNPRITKKVSKILKIELENGEIIKCTLNHKFLCRNANGSLYYKEAMYLSENDNIISPYDNIKDSIKYLKSMKYSGNKIIYILGDFIKYLYLKGFSMGRIQSEYNLPKTGLNAYLSDVGIKRNRKEAFDNATKLGLNEQWFNAHNLIDYKEHARKMYNNPEIIENRRQTMIKVNKDPKFRKRNQIKALERWRNPEYRKMMSEKVPSGWGKHQKYVSKRFNKEWYLKSNCERIFAELCETNSNIYDIDYESLRIPYTDHDGVERSYIPDFIVMLKSGKRFIIEIKYRENLNNLSEINELKYNSANRYCQENGFEFLWITKRDMREGILL